MYHLGQGLKQDDFLALIYYSSAANKGSIYSLYSLGELSYQKAVISKDYRDAYKWSYIASLRGYKQNGSEVIPNLLEKTENKLNAQQIAKCRKWAQNWLSYNKYSK